MDYRNYIDKKTKGLVQIVKAGGGIAFSRKRFSSETGVLLNVEEEATDLQILQARKQELLDELAGINVIITDIKALLVVA